MLVTPSFHPDAAVDEQRSDRQAWARVPFQLPGGWQAVAFAARGELCNVYRARPAGASHPGPAQYALKLLRGEWQGRPAAIELITREARAGREVIHPRLIPILAAHVQGPPYYVVMPWIEGTNLAEHLNQSGRLAPARAFWIARQVAEALAALHEGGWLHGDVKPANILVAPCGRVTLVDLGFARPLGQEPSSPERVLLGTAHYFAPELLRHPGRVAPTADIYALGVTLYEMLTGTRPIVGREWEEILRGHCSQRVESVRRRVPWLSRAAAELVAEMLAKEPLRRPGNPREVVRRLVALEIEHLADRMPA